MDELRIQGENEAVSEKISGEISGYSDHLNKAMISSIRTRCSFGQASIRANEQQIRIISYIPFLKLVLYPIESKAFSIYIVDHNTSILLTEVKEPGVTFVYHPGLVGDNNAAAKNITLLEDQEPFPEDEESFDFLAWFDETAKYADFVVLKMNTSEVEMKFLSGLIQTGAICYLDELFLHCSNEPDCINVLQSLRSRGVFVHQRWGGD